MCLHCTGKVSNCSIKRHYLCIYKSLIREKISKFSQLYKFLSSHSCHFVKNYYTPRKLCRGYTVFTLSVRASVRPCVRPSVTLCFLNNSKSHCRIFIKPCKHVHICKTNTLDKKVRARGQFY